MKTQRLYAEHTATIKDAKANPNILLEQAEGGSVAVLAHNKTRYYMVPPGLYESMVDALETFQRDSAEIKTFDAQFRPGRERSKAIAQACAQAIMSASDKDLGDFKEY